MPVTPAAPPTHDRLLLVAQVDRLNDRQVTVLRWIADGRPARDWPDESHKNTARSLAARGLAQVGRKKKVWTATITELGQYVLDHGHPPAYTNLESETRSRFGGFRRDPDDDHPALDAPARAMRRVHERRRPAEVKHTKREIRERYMRYKVVVTRVQVAERFVRATSEEDAAARTQEKLNKPYGYFGSWKTTNSEVDVIEAEETTVIGPTNLAETEPYLLSVKDAAKALGISCSSLYQMMTQGDIEWVAIGSRKYISREHLMEFIKRNTHRGYYLAR